jgi:hypothetical protein
VGAPGEVIGPGAGHVTGGSRAVGKGQQEGGRGADRAAVAAYLSGRQVRNLVVVGW